MRASCSQKVWASRLCRLARFFLGGVCLMDSADAVAAVGQVLRVFPRVSQLSGKLVAAYGGQL